MIYLLIIYVASYIMMEILWVYILEEDNSFLDEFVGSDKWCGFGILINISMLVGLPLLVIWGYYTALENALEGLDQDDVNN